MLIRQRLSKLLYPLIMRVTGSSKQAGQILRNSDRRIPPISFYGLQGVLNDGTPLDLSAWKGKKILLVNTASHCGYTAQYGELESLYERYKDRLVVLGFPANDFREQEKGSDEAIAAFCQLNFGVQFPLMKKSRVVKGVDQHPIYQWLTDPSRNGWNSQAPVWNFCKYVVDEKGVLTHYFAMGVSPLSPALVSAVSGEGE